MPLKQNLIRIRDTLVELDLGSPAVGEILDSVVDDLNAILTRKTSDFRRPMIMEAIRDRTGERLNVEEAIYRHMKGERYSHPKTGARLRLHIPKASNAPQAHFEHEPRPLKRRGN